MPRGRPKQPAAPAPDAMPVDIPEGDADTGDPDPALEDERADGGDTRNSGGLSFGGPGGDPFEKLRQQMGMTRTEEPVVELPQPGSSQAITEEALARRGTTEYPDDMLVSVKFWEVNDLGVAGDPIMVAHNVLYSIAKDPTTWIEYGGKWYMELLQPETKKKLVRKAFTTRGEPAPKSWRPRIGGDEMDEAKFANAMVMALRGTGVIPNQPQMQGLPPGTVPQGVYGDVPGQMRGEIVELKGKIDRLEKERDEAKDGKNDMARQRDLAQQEVKTLEREIRDLRDQKTELQRRVDSAPKSDKPDWAYAAELFSKRGEDGIKTGDLLKLQEKFTDALAVLKGGGGGQAEAIGQLNTAMDLIEKMRKAAGLPTSGPGGGAKDEDTLNKLLGLAGKAADLVKGRQRLVEIERGSSPPAQSQPSQPRTDQPQRSEQDMDKEALERTLHRLEVAIHQKVNPTRVGQMLASAITWAAAMDFASLDADVKTFMGKIVEDPDKWIVWYVENLDPKIEGATEYGQQVSESFKLAMNRGQTTTPPAPADKPNGGNGKSWVEPSMSQPVSPPPVAQPGSIGGDGGVLPSPPAPDDPQAVPDAVVQPEAEAVAEAPKVN